MATLFSLLHAGQTEAIRQGKYPAEHLGVSELCAPAIRREKKDGNNRLPLSAVGSQ